jgi:hypothetical protein
MSDDIRGAEMTHVGAESAAPLLLAFQPHPNTATRTTHVLTIPIYVQHKLTTMLGGTRRKAMHHIPGAFFTVGLLHTTAHNTVSCTFVVRYAEIATIKPFFGATTPSRPWPPHSRAF